MIYANRLARGLSIAYILLTVLAIVAAAIVGVYKQDYPEASKVWSVINIASTGLLAAFSLAVNFRLFWEVQRDLDNLESEYQASPSMTDEDLVRKANEIWRKYGGSS